MAPSDDPSLKVLVDEPNETLEVEYKEWLDLSNVAVRATLARHIAALANYGGGDIVFGFTDAMEFAGQNQFPLLACDRDLIASIVKKYLDPTFQCDVREVRSAAGNTHPIVIVPPHGATPVCVKANGPLVNGKTMGVVQGVHYTRKPGPASEQIQTAAEWAPIIRRCAMHDRTAIFGALDVALRRSGASSPTALDALKQWHDAAHAAFLKDAGASDRAKWHWQASYAIECSDGEVLDVGSLLEILRQVHREVLDTVDSGWNMMNPQGLIDVRPAFQTDSASGLGDADFLECSAMRSRVGVSIADLWRVSPEGKVTIIRDYWEDTFAPSTGGMPPGSYLSPNWMVRSLAEIVRHARALTERFENPISASFRCEWYGLQGRIVHTPNTMWSFRWPNMAAGSDHRVATGTFPVTMLENGLPEIVFKLMGPLMRTFTTEQLIDPVWINSQRKT